MPFVLTECMQLNN